MRPNHGLTFFLILTILVSVFGTFLLINGISSFPGFSYTGFATSGTSATSITVVGAAAVSVAPTSINFGNIKVTSGFTGANCTFQSGNNGSFVEYNSGCDTVPSYAGFINITNIGSSSLNISINASENATVFLSNYTGSPATEPLFEANVTTTTHPNSCGIGLSGAENLIPLNKTHNWGGGAENSSIVVCQNLQSNSSYNRLNMGLRIRVPVESMPTSKSVTINVFAAGL